MSSDFDDLLDTTGKPVGREPKTWTSYAKVDPKHRGVDVDEWDALIANAKPTKPKKKQAPHKQPFIRPVLEADEDFGDLLEAINEEAQRIAEWRPESVVLGQALVRCRCCAYEEVQTIGVFLKERHLRSNALSYKRIVGRISDWLIGLPREVDTLATDYIPECVRCFALGEEESAQKELELAAYVPGQSHLAMLCNHALDMRAQSHGAYYAVVESHIAKD
jgi:hypothetical protein